MDRRRKSPRTHSRKELAATPPPVVLCVLVVGFAVMLFAVITWLLE